MVLKSNILQTLADAQKASAYALEARDRQYALMFGVVTDNQDPNNLRRIKVSLEGKGGLVSTDWVMAMRLIPNLDPPLPQVGTSVIVAAIDGDPHDLIWLGPVINQTNPQDDRQSDPINDNSQTIPGDNREEIKGASTTVIDKSWDITTTEHTHHRTQLLMYDLLRLQLAEGLPEANEENRGKMAVVKGTQGASPDRSFICLRNRNGSYSWVNFASGSNTP